MIRRAFLKKGLAGGALLLVAGAGVAAFPPRLEAAPRRALVFLDERLFAILAAVAARVVTVEGADVIEITHVMDHALSRAAPEAQADVRRLILLFENALAGLLLDGRFGTFTRLSTADQDRALLAWRDSRLAVRRSGYKALRNLCVTSYYRTEQAWAVVGYPGPPDSLTAQMPSTAPDEGRLVSE